MNCTQNRSAMRKKYIARNNNNYYSSLHNYSYTLHNSTRIYANSISSINNVVNYYVVTIDVHNISSVLLCGFFSNDISEF